MSGSYEFVIVVITLMITPREIHFCNTLIYWKIGVVY